MRRLRPFLFLAVGCLVVAVGGVLWAHGGRLPFLFWGDFPRSYLACQRAIGRAVHLCSVGTLQLYARCASGATSSGECSATARQRILESLRTSALDLIDRYCSDRAAVQLGFLALLEAQSDISRACADVDRWARSHFPDPSALDGNARVCLAFQAERSLGLIRFATREYRRLFDWLAFHRPPPSQRNALLNACRARIQSAASKLSGLAELYCPAGSDGGGESAQLFADAARRAECIVGAAYVQDAVHCDTPTPAVSPTPTPTPSAGAEVTQETVAQIRRSAAPGC